MLEYVKKRPDPGAAPGFGGFGESSDPAAFAQAAVAGERSRPIDLDAGIRHRMESHFGLDFGKVRLAQSDLPGKMGVDAIAQGDLIRFAPGAYRPGSSEGEKLLGHELGHLVRQSRMGPGLAGLPIDDPVSESGADNMAMSALSGSAGAVRAFTPAPAASAPMEGGRLWNRIKQETHRWLLGGKLGSWWQRRKNKAAVRDSVKSEAVRNYKTYAEPWKDAETTADHSMKCRLQDSVRGITTARGYWDQYQNDNPVQAHPEFYPPLIMPKELREMFGSIPGNALNEVERSFLQSAAGNYAVTDTFDSSFSDENGIRGMPTLAKVYRRYKSRVVEQGEYQDARNRMENPTAMVPGGDKPENHKIWKATSAQLGGSHTNPFNDGRLAVKQEAIENAESVDDVQKAMDLYVFGHRTWGKIGGSAQGNLNLRTVKDMAKNLAHIVEDFPDIKELVREHSGTEGRPHAQMFVSPRGSMGWSGTNNIMTGNSLVRAAEDMYMNLPNPHSTTSTDYSAVHEAGHLVDYALSRKIFRGRKEDQIEQASSNGHGSDVIMRYVLTKLVNSGNKDATEILEELKASNPNITSFKDMDLTEHSNPDGTKSANDDAMRLTKALKAHGITSNYGSTSPMETFAEAYARVYEQGEDADEFSKGLVETSQEMLQHPKRLDRLFEEYDNSHTDVIYPDMPTPLYPQPQTYQPTNNLRRRRNEEPQWYQIRSVDPAAGEGTAAGTSGLQAVPVPAPAPMPVTPRPTRTGGAAGQPYASQMATPPVQESGGSAPPPAPAAAAFDEDSSSYSDADSSSYSDEDSSSYSDESSTSSDESSTSSFSDESSSFLSDESSTSSEHSSERLDEDEEFWKSLGYN